MLQMYSMIGFEDSIHPPLLSHIDLFWDLGSGIWDLGSGTGDPGSSLSNFFEIYDLGRWTMDDEV